MEDFLERSGMTPARFGKESIGNDKVVLSLRRGKDVRSGTAEQIDKFIADFWEKHPDHENHPHREAAEWSNGERSNAAKTSPRADGDLTRGNKQAATEFKSV